MAETTMSHIYVQQDETFIPIITKADIDMYIVSPLATVTPSMASMIVRGT